MGIAKYEIFGQNGTWRIRHDGKAENEYATKEAAFEAAIARNFHRAARGPRCHRDRSSGRTTTGASTN